MSVGTRLRALHEAQGLTQGALCERAGMLRQTVERLARALGVPASALLPELESPPPPAAPSDVMAALVASLPPPGTRWPRAKQEAWLRAAAANLALLYDDPEDEPSA